MVSSRIKKGMISSSVWGRNETYKTVNIHLLKRLTLRAGHRVQNKYYFLQIKTCPVEKKKRHSFNEPKIPNFLLAQTRFNISRCCSGSWPGPPCAGEGVSYGCPPPAPAPAWPVSAAPPDWPPSAGPSPADTCAESPRSENVIVRH